MKDARLEASSVAPAVVKNGKELMPYSRVRQETESYYIEVQIWRPVGLDDVDGLIFTGPEPSGEFLKALQARGISIYRRKFIGPSILGKFFDELWWSPTHKTSP